MTSIEAPEFNYLPTRVSLEIGCACPTCASRRVALATRIYGKTVIADLGAAGAALRSRGASCVGTAEQ